MSFDLSQGFGMYIQVHLFDLNDADEKTLIYKQPYCIITHLMTAQGGSSFHLTTSIQYFNHSGLQPVSQFDQH